MPISTIEKTIEINAPAESVWRVLTENALVNEWSGEFMPGSYVDGEFKLDGTVRFFDPDKNGLQAHITTFDENDVLTYEYEIEFIKGEGDKDSPNSQVWHGCYDTFTLAEANGGTSLTITSTFPSEYLEAFEPSWDESVVRIKEVAELLQYNKCMITVTSPKTKKVLIASFIVFDIVVLLAIAGFVVFKDQFDTWGRGLENMSDWKENYKQDNPGSTDAEADAALKKSFAEIELWKEEYKRKNPGATDQEADKAWSATWEK